jgi:hypothetical protein
MKKIWILAGVVLFIVLVIMCWMFFGEFFNFAKNLSEGSEGVIDEKSSFVGTWETTYIEGDNRFVGFNGVYKFYASGAGLIGGLDSTWDIVDNKLVIHYYGGAANLTYDYSFSNEDNTLTITNSNGALEFIKK